MKLQSNTSKFNHGKCILDHKLGNVMKNSEDNKANSTVILPNDGDYLDFGGSDMYAKIGSVDTNGRFSVAHEIIAPKTLAAPLHYHQNEDEYSYVIKGRLGVLLGDEVVEAEPGTWVFKPRHQWHTYWNAGDTLCHMIEVISPAGFENFFREVAEVFDSDIKLLEQLNEKYGLKMNLESVPELCERFGLAFSEM